MAEETGYVAKNVQLLTKVYPAPYMSNDLQYVFVATNLVKSTKNLEKGELINSKVIKLRDAIKMIHDGRITDAVTIAAILMVSSN